MPGRKSSIRWRLKHHDRQPRLRVWRRGPWWSVRCRKLASRRRRSPYPQQERQQIISDYYGTYQAMVRDDPEGHGMDYVHAYTVISRAC